VYRFHLLEPGRSAGPRWLRAIRSDHGRPPAAGTRMDRAVSFSSGGRGSDRAAIGQGQP
jgi:hypothetical protein